MKKVEKLVGIFKDKIKKTDLPFEKVKELAMEKAMKEKYKKNLKKFLDSLTALESFENIDPVEYVDKLRGYYDERELKLIKNWDKDKQIKLLKRFKDDRSIIEQWDKIKNLK
jgi:hypothetical protein